ncbi:hypothetical protein FKM82_015543 [Ascaphus truei]
MNISKTNRTSDPEDSNQNRPTIQGSDVPDIPASSSRRGYFARPAQHTATQWQDTKESDSRK